MKNQLSLVKTQDIPPKKLTKFQSYLAYFFFFSFTGWIMETIYSYIILGHFTNRGFFYGPVCPIYGCGGIMLLTFIGKIKKKPLQMALTSIIVFSIFEYAIGYGLEALYQIQLWDYSNDFMNLNSRISLFYSLAWGFIAIIFVYLIIPLLNKLAKKVTTLVPYIVQILLVRLFSIIFFIDILYSFIEYSHIHI